MTRLRLGMVGGGEGAFIGAVHRIAARLDDRWELVAGAFSSDPERSRASGAKLHVAPDRAYASFGDMAEREAARADRIDAVAIVTPNHLHGPAAAAFLRRGIPVICDKPLTTGMEDALALEEIVRSTGVPFALTHNYSGYPLVRQARAMVQAGELGALRVVQVEYAQEWLTTNIEATGNKQAVWRLDPIRNGIGGSVGDIGTHAFHLAEFVTGLRCEKLVADFSVFGAGRALDDNAHMLLRFEGRTRGALWCSQVAPGNENALRLRIYGEQGGLEWAQEQPNQLRHSPFGQPSRIIGRAGAGAGAAAAHASRIPSGHPEGYLEAFAQLYSDFAEQLEARRDGRMPDPASLLVPGIEAGLRGMQFILAAFTSHHDGSRWKVLGADPEAT